ncbi:MAG: DUF3188 domain-containing protein [Cyanobacteria bacterium REEB417]|nr:DUF3188 domain-containing protein [Cyanobacteria bacterium REEB417]
MKERERSVLLALLALAAPLLVLLSSLTLVLRQGPSRLQALPPLLIGSGLVLSSVAARRRQRRQVLQSLGHADG